ASGIAVEPIEPARHLAFRRRDPGRRPGIDVIRHVHPHGLLSPLSSLGAVLSAALTESEIRPESSESNPPREMRMRVFIVHAHHEPQSFNGAMTREATAALTGAGHEVVVSDLYAMGFDPVSDRRNFTTVKDGERLRQQAEEAYAAEHDGFA